MSGDPTLILHVNGVKRVLPRGRGDTTLLEYLRDDLRLTGAKLGCGVGGCGSCTVMVSWVHPVRKEVVHRAINACLCPLYGVEGMHVVTVEGIGSTIKGMHPLQKSLATSHGTQCGFCSPGMVMSMYALLRSKGHEKLTEKEIQDCLAGNLCRCTGYRPILASFEKFAGAYADDILHGKVAEGATGEEGTICPSTGKPCSCKNGENTAPNGCTPAINGEPIFPPELMMRETPSFADHGDKVSWYRPTALGNLLDLKAEMPHAVLVCGQTTRGLSKSKEDGAKRDAIHVGRVPEMCLVSISEDGLSIGAANSVTDLAVACKNIPEDIPEWKTSFFRAIESQIQWFASPPIKNAGSIGGNIIAARSVSDLVPLFIVCGVTYTLHSKSGGSRTVSAKKFYLSDSNVDMKPDEVLTDILIPFSQEFEYLMEFKQGQRRGNSFAIVNAGFKIQFECVNGSWVVKDSCLAYGGFLLLLSWHILHLNV
eukprot:jgi/Picre1/29027/NNA_004421.t1